MLNKILEVLQSPLFLNSVIGVLAVTTAILKALGSIFKKKAIDNASEIVDLVADIFKNSSNETKLTRAIDLLRNKVLEITPQGFKWLANALLSTTVLKFAIERTITQKRVAEAVENKAKETIADVVKEVVETK